jgi:L-2-hydroxyglutarate oxidase LhgO
MCLDGRSLLLRYCKEREIPHRPVGKLIVATDDEEILTLERLMQNARANGISDLEALTPQAVRKIEPAVLCTAAVLSPHTAIIDSHAYMNALQKDILDAGGQIIYSTQVYGGYAQPDGMILAIRHRQEPILVHATTTINCAGLTAPHVSAMMSGKKDLGLDYHRAVGHYFKLTGKESPFRRLIYPVPVSGGLGIHATLDMAGACRFGPDVYWETDEIGRRRFDMDYTFRADTATRKANFVRAIRRYYPDLNEDALHPDYVGIRPKAGAEGSNVDDFIFDGPSKHGAPGWFKSLLLSPRV